MLLVALLGAVSLLLVIGHQQQQAVAQLPEP